MDRVSGSTPGSNPLQPARESAYHVKGVMDNRQLKRLIGDQYLQDPPSRQWSVNGKLPLAAKADQFFQNHVSVF